MSDPGKYTFLPWLRQGISTQVNQTEGTKVEGRASVTARVVITGGTESSPVDVTLGLFGPGDVKTLDTRAITRHWPRPDVFEVEPNLFPLLELFPADLPWRYTPAKASAQDRLRPWLALIVLRDDEIARLDAPTAALPLGKLTTKAGAPLPRVDQLWAWTHVHVDGASAITTGQLQSILDDTAHHAVARLLCPRRLDARIAYTAFLVPALEAARRSALGQPVDAKLDQLAPAWSNDGTAVELPVFYSWRFQTSELGDFESLARRIVAQALPATAGERPMEVAKPGMDLTQAASTPLAVESALRALDATSTPWDTAERTAWTGALAGLVNLAEQRLEGTGVKRTLVPPLYGRWYAATAKLDTTPQDAWFQDVNADPRTRVAAALGWQIVQNDEQQLLAGAWAQVDAVREANAALRQAQLAREAARRLYERHVMVRSESSVVGFARALHGRVRMTQTPAATVQAQIRTSPLRAGVLEPSFVRISRSLGPIGVRQGRAFSTSKPTVIDRVNSGALPIAPPPATPVNMITPARACGKDSFAPLLPAPVTSWLHHVPRALWDAIEHLIELVLTVWPHHVDRRDRERLRALLREVQKAVRAGAAPADAITRLAARCIADITPDEVAAAPSRPGFVAQEIRIDDTIPDLPQSGAPEDPRFRRAAIPVLVRVQLPPTPGDTLRPIDIPATAKKILTEIDPDRTVPATFQHSLGVRTPWRARDPLDPVMAAPSFPQPLYRPLYAISPAWILTGFDELRGDVASLAHPNERFIESFMLGANDGMGRALLFNEYPTDQRGTYFRQFWDVAGVPSPRPDINPIAAWPRTAKLGDNASRPGGDSNLVLVVRAELLRRYPNTIVYAIKAQWNPDKKSRSVPDKPVELHPEFLGSLGDGAGFWGFQLTAADARGSDVPADGKPGWYFALQEHSSEPRFGLEPAGATFATKPTSWQKLAWSDLAPDAAALAKLAYIDLGDALPDVSSIVDPLHARWHTADGARASDLAYITYREPVRLLVHASRMIPADA